MLFRDTGRELTVYITNDEEEFLRVEAELVYLSDEQGEYRQPLFRRLREELAALGLEALIGSPGGVRLAPLSAAAVLKSRAAFFVGEPPWRLPPSRLQPPERSPLPSLRCCLGRPPPEPRTGPILLEKSASCVALPELLGSAYRV